jgi:tripartite-type tricarboxylate transporter receptor subunit TctC
MKLPRRKFLQLTASVAALPAGSRFALAQDYPSRPITMVVPAAAGGPVDTVARTVAERMKLLLGQPVIVENVTGGAGSIGVGKVARASPDGYTLIVGFSGTHVFNAAIQNLSYDVLTDFQPIAMTSNVPHLIVAKAGNPSKTLEELLVWLKANQDKVSTGMGAPAPPPISLQFYSRTSPGSGFSSCRIVAPRQRCRISWRGRSICCSMWRPIRCRI